MSTKVSDMFAMFDTTNANVGVEIPILKVDGDESGLFVTVLGTDSSTYQKINERLERARLRVIQKGGSNAMDTVYDSAKKSDFELVAECTISWRHVSGDMPFEASDKDKLIEHYAKYPFMFEQVRRAMNDRANFIKG